MKIMADLCCRGPRCPRCRGVSGAGCGGRMALDLGGDYCHARGGCGECRVVAPETVTSVLKENLAEDCWPH